MKFLSIDIETTGLDPVKNQVIEFGVVFVDEWQKKAQKNWIIKHEEYSGSAYAINLNNRIFYELSKKESEEDIIHVDYFTYSFKQWLINECGYTQNLDETITFIAAGKNFAGFDLQFLKNIIGWNDYFRVASRVLDPAVLYFDATIDKELPNLSTCKRRSGLFIDDVVSHKAVEDAEDVADLLISKLSNPMNEFPRILGIEDENAVCQINFKGIEIKKGTKLLWNNEFEIEVEAIRLHPTLRFWYKSEWHLATSCKPLLNF